MRLLCIRHPGGSTRFFTGPAPSISGLAWPPAPPPPTPPLWWQLLIEKPHSGIPDLQPPLIYSFMYSSCTVLLSMKNERSQIFLKSLGKYVHTYILYNNNTPSLVFVICTLISVFVDADATMLWPNLCTVTSQLQYIKAKPTVPAILSITLTRPSIYNIL
jgi:hypothetical protein